MKINYYYCYLQNLLACFPFFVFPSSLGQSQSGKSQWVYKYLQNLRSLYNPDVDFKSIIYCYGERDALKNIPTDIRQKLTLVPGIPDNLTALAVKKPAIIIFDDLYSVVFKTESLVNLFLNSVHHSDTTVVLTSQVLFPKERNARLLTLNSQYILFCPSPRTNAQFGHLATQIAAPGERKALLEAYNDHITNSPPCSPFLLDLHPLTPNWARYRTSIFPTDECTVVYCHKKHYNADGSFASEVTTPDSFK